MLYAWLYVWMVLPQILGSLPEVIRRGCHHHHHQRSSRGRLEWSARFHRPSRRAAGPGKRHSASGTPCAQPRDVRSAGRDTWNLTGEALGGPRKRSWRRCSRARSGYGAPLGHPAIRGAHSCQEHGQPLRRDDAIGRVECRYVALQAIRHQGWPSWQGRPAPSTPPRRSERQRTSPTRAARPREWSGVSLLCLALLCSDTGVSTHGICTTTNRSGNQGHTHAPTLRRDGESHTHRHTGASTVL